MLEKNNREKSTKCAKPKVLCIYLYFIILINFQHYYMVITIEDMLTFFGSMLL